MTDVDEMREVVARILEFFGSKDSYEGSTLETSDPETGDVIFAEIPVELASLLDELRDVLDDPEEHDEEEE